MDNLSAYLPKSFGKQSSSSQSASQAGGKRQASEEVEQARGGKRADTREQESPVVLPVEASEQGSVAGLGDVEGEEEEEELEEEEDILSELPITHEAVLKDHDRAISALAIDRAGMRVATGSFDFTVKYWDFGGMDRRLRPFRSVEPCEGHQVRDLVYSLTGDRLLVAPNGNQAKVYDRDGAQLLECAHGDMYIRDMRHTKGHVSAVTGCRWDAMEKNTFYTSSMDSSIRIWDVNDFRGHKSVLVHKSKAPGTRWGITTMDVSSDGKSILSASDDGSIGIWAARGPHHRPRQTVDKAHTRGEEIGSVVFSHGGGKFVSRSMDGTVKLWDMRQLKTPVVRPKEGVVAAYAESNLAYSPDGSMIIAGTSSREKGKDGSLLILDASSLDTLHTLPFSGTGVIKVAWHPTINQILTGMSDGTCRVLYEPTRLSTKGAMLCATRTPRRQDAGEGIVGGQVILTPFAADPSVNLGKERASARARTKPVQADSFGKGVGGKIGSSLTTQIMRDLNKDTRRDVDPREAFLRHAEAAEADPYWVGPAYKKAQEKKQG